MEKHLCEILDRRVRQHSLTPSSKHQMREYILEEWCSIPPVEFQRLVESMPRCIEAVLVARGAQHLTKTCYVGFSFNLSPVYMLPRGKRSTADMTVMLHNLLTHICTLCLECISVLFSIILVIWIVVVLQPLLAKISITTRNTWKNEHEKFCFSLIIS